MIEWIIARNRPVEKLILYYVVGKFGDIDHKNNEGNVYINIMEAKWLIDYIVYFPLINKEL